MHALRIRIRHAKMLQTCAAIFRCAASDDSIIRSAAFYELPQPARAISRNVFFNIIICHLRVQVKSCPKTLQLFTDLFSNFKRRVTFIYCSANAKLPTPQSICAARQQLFVLIFHFFIL